MTVCIAAICDTGLIVGAADTMRTAGDLEFAPIRQSIPRFGKIHPLTNSIAMMLAGDTTFQAELYFRYLLPRVRQWIKDNPTHWLPIEQAVRYYCEAFDLLCRERAERQILAPLGLTYDTFISRQHQMDERFISKITQDLLNFPSANTQAIFAGVDSELFDGAPMSRLYVVNQNQASCYDTIRFASIGSGSRHANSHLMLSGHHANASLADTLFAVYVAKKKAESAPGVGMETNMFVLGPALGTFNWLNDEVQNELDAAYRAKLKAERRASDRANVRIEQYLQAIVSKSTAQGPQTNGPDNPPPAA